MKATFPVKSFPWKHYAIPALFCIIAVAVSALVYDDLPDKIAVHFDAHGRPNGWEHKATYMLIMLGAMAGMLVFFILLDRLLVYPSFPAPLMSAIAGAMEIFFLAIHLGIIKVYELEGVPVWTIMTGISVLAAAYVIAHSLLAKPEAPERPEGVHLWTDYPPHGILDTIFFFVRPILPKEIAAYEDGLLIRATLYTFTFPWEDIQSIKITGGLAAIAGMGVRLASSPANAIEMKTAGLKRPLIFSVSDCERLIAEWKKRRQVAQQNHGVKEGSYDG